MDQSTNPQGYWAEIGMRAWIEILQGMKWRLRDFEVEKGKFLLDVVKVLCQIGITEIGNNWYFYYLLGLPESGSFDRLRCSMALS